MYSYIAFASFYLFLYNDLNSLKGKALVYMSELSDISLAPYQHLNPISEQVYAAIKDAVLSGVLQVGDNFTDTLVAAHFSISRTPAREGLLRLEREGFLESVSRKGFVVRNIRSQDAQELYTVALALETTAAYQAARNRSQLDLDKMADILEKDELSVTTASDANFSFHLQLAQASGNRLLFEYIKQIREKMKILHSFHDQADSYPSEQAFVLNSNASHRKIYDAVVAQDCELAELFMRRHLQVAQEHFLASVKAGAAL